MQPHHYQAKISERTICSNLEKENGDGDGDGDIGIDIVGGGSGGELEEASEDSWDSERRD